MQGKTGKIALFFMFIELLREEAGKNKGYISVDTSERGTDAGAEEELDNAA